MDGEPAHMPVVPIGLSRTFGSIVRNYNLYQWALHEADFTTQQGANSVDRNWQKGERKKLLDKPQQSARMIKDCHKNFHPSSFSPTIHLHARSTILRCRVLFYQYQHRSLSPNTIMDANHLGLRGTINLRVMGAWSQGHRGSLGLCIVGALSVFRRSRQPNSS